MPRKLRAHLTFANVTSATALFVALATGGAYAANTVFSTDIVDGQVKTADLDNGAVSVAKLADGSITGDKVKDGSIQSRDVLDNNLKGADIDESTLTNIGGGGPAGGDLTGTYPNPQLKGGSVTPEEIGPAPAARLRVNGSPTIPPSAGNQGTITWTVEDFDVAGMYSPGNPTVLTAPRPGLYEVTANVVIRRDSGASGIYRAVSINQDGTSLIEEARAPQPATGYREGYSVSALAAAVAGSTWQVVVAHDAANPLALDSNTYTNFSARWVGPLP